MKATAALQPVQGNAVADYWHEKALALAGEWKLAASEVCFQRALQAQDRPDYRANYANLLRRAAKFDRAEREAKRALRDMPDSLDVLGNLGTLHMDRGDMKKAIELLEGPSAVSHFHHFCLAISLLHDGQWERGFRAYDARLEKLAPVYRIQPWQGEDLAGKVLAVHHEQGFGDTIMFSRFLDLLPSEIDYRFGMPSPLMRLFEAKYGARVQSAHAQIAADYAVPLMSLPARLGLKGLPPSNPYLNQPIPFVVPRPPMTKLAVGIVWRSKSGGRDHKPEEEAHGDRKSIPLELLLPLAGIPGVSLFSLQTGDAIRDIDRLDANGLIDDLGWSSMDFADLAGFIGEMDLVVSVDTAPAHLAGAMGKPAIVLVPYVGAWQWMSGSKSAWYPTVDVIRQRRPFDWAPVAEELLESVRNRV